MGTMRLALPWEARISLEPRHKEIRHQDLRHGETRLTPSDFTQRSSSPAADSSPHAMDDAALVSACQAGDIDRDEAIGGRAVPELALGTGSPALDPSAARNCAREAGAARRR